MVEEVGFIAESPEMSGETAGGGGREGDSCVAAGRRRGGGDNGRHRVVAREASLEWLVRKQELLGLRLMW